METLSDEFNPVVLENYEFGKRQMKNNEWIFLNDQPIDHQILRTQSEIVPPKSQLKFYHYRFRH